MNTRKGVKYSSKFENYACRTLDGAGENTSGAVRDFCKHHGIGFEPSPSYMPQSNGAAERLIQEHWTRESYAV